MYPDAVVKFGRSRRIFQTITFALGTTKDVRIKSFSSVTQSSRTAPEISCDIKTCDPHWDQDALALQRESLFWERFEDGALPAFTHRDYTTEFSPFGNIHRPPAALFRDVLSLLIQSYEPVADTIVCLAWALVFIFQKILRIKCLRPVWLQVTFRPFWSNLTFIFYIREGY